MVASRPSASRRPRSYLLARVPLFSGLSRRHLARVASVAEERSHREGHVLVEAGDPGGAFYVVVSGRVKVVKGSRTEATLGPGDFFGELALLDGRARTRTVIALTPLETVKIERPAFRGLLRKDPNLGMALLEGMAGRMRGILDSPSA